MLIKHNKNSKSFIQIPIFIAIIISVLIVGAGGYFGVRQYQSYQAQKIEKEKLAQESERLKQEEAEQKEKEKQEMEKLKKEVENLKNQKPQIIKEIPSQNSENQGSQQSSNTPSQPSQSSDISSVIDKWKPLVVFIQCDFFNKDNSYAFSQAGSGTLFLFSDCVGIQTNKHVISKELTLIGGLATPDYCTVKFSGNNKVYYVYHHTESGVFNMQAANDESDGARLIIREPDSFIWNLVSQQGYYCKRKPSLGENIVILGYPSIGSKTDITATEGIISGYDYSVNSGNYYITSAKVEHGNSGGASILIKDNCWLGIPTFAQVGEIESLARILDEPGLLK